LFLLLAATALVIYIEKAGSPEGWSFVWWWIEGQTKAFVCSVALVFVTLVALTALLKRPLLIVGTLTAMASIMSFASLHKYMIRGMWLLPDDFKLAGEARELAGMVGIWEVILTLVVAVVIVGLSVVANHFFEQWRQRYMAGQPVIRKRTGWIVRSVVAAGATAVFLAMSWQVFFPQERFNEKTWMGTDLIKWNQLDNYRYNGFIVGFLFNLRARTVEKPAGWTEGAATEIAAKYQTTAADSNMRRVDLAEEDVSVILIQNESFADPEWLAEYYPYSGGDITPNLHAWEEYAFNRRMFSPEYGGGTANVEFEALTGLSNYWYGGLPFNDVVSRRTNFPSLARLLGGMGYQSIGIHPYNGEFYKRRVSYEHMGFAEFYDQKAFDNPSHAGASEYISDQAAYDKTLEILNRDDQKKFISLITMQNHTPYGGNFSEAEREFKVPGKSNSWMIEDYFQTLHESDAALGRLIESLRVSDKKVAVVFYGDHQPGLWEELVGGEQDALAHQTPLVIWKNYEENGTLAEVPEAVSPNQIPNLLFDVMGAQKPFLYYLLDDLMQEAPALTRVGGWSAKETEVLRDYEFINYQYLAKKL
jgi:phosphoglycerol transferase MdoB-like AlkP superfamily enzyme